MRVTKVNGKNMQILTYGPEKRYAKALVELLSAGSSKKDIQSVEAVLHALANTDDVKAFLNDDSQSLSAKTQSLVALADAVKATDTVKNFLAVMGEKGRAAYVATTLKLTLSMLDGAEGKVVAEVRTAAELTKSQKDDITKFVKEAHKEASDIVIEEIVDPSVIAGVTLTVGSKQYDNSLRGALRSFSQSLSGK